MPDDFLSSDAASVTFPQASLQDAVKGDRQEQLEAIRDYITRELEANLCSNCTASRLHTGQQAALILQLRNVLSELDGLPKSKGTVSRLDRARLQVVGRTPESAPKSGPDPSEQRRTGSRRVGRDGRSGT